MPAAPGPTDGPPSGPSGGGLACKVRAIPALSYIDERNDPRAAGTCRRHYAVEHALYVVYVENRASAGGGLHRGTQTGRI